MGEEAKQEEAKVAEAPKKEEKPAEEKKEEKKEEEKKEEAKPSPPPPIILFVYLHCVGCAKKIERSILKCRGVEEVETNIEKNEVTVKGMVNPQVLCSRIQKKTSRNIKILSPLPPADAADSAKAEPPVPQEASGIATVELRVNMHCEACAQQLRKKIMKMRGVQTAETDLSANKVTVSGCIKGDKLVEYIYRRTGKIATVIPPSPPPLEEKKDDGEKKAEEKPSEEKKDDGKSEEKKEGQSDGQNKEEIPAAGGEGADQVPKKEESAVTAQGMSSNAEEMMKMMMYWNGTGGGYMMNHHDERMMMMHHWMPMPMPMPMPTPAMMYVFEQQQLPPPPQMFSDENPNACCIS